MTQHHVYILVITHCRRLLHSRMHVTLVIILFIAGRFLERARSGRDRLEVASTLPAFQRTARRAGEEAGTSEMRLSRSYDHIFGTEEIISNYRSLTPTKRN